MLECCWREYATYQKEKDHSLKNGAPGRSRTRDLRFTKPLLYQLSYKGVLENYFFIIF
jgi:hypothetical protein